MFTCAYAIVTSSCVLDCLDVAVGAVVVMRVADGGAGTAVVAVAASVVAAAAGAPAEAAAAAAAATVVAVAAAVAVTAAAVAAAVPAAVPAAVRAFCSASPRGTRHVLIFSVWVIPPCFFRFFVPRAVVVLGGPCCFRFFVPGAATCVFIRCMQKNVDLEDTNG
jgi:hypothetical protein